MQIQLFLNHHSEGGHGNLTLSMPFLDELYIMDTYYFALDNSFLPNDESHNKVILSLVKNLRYWVDKTNKLLDNEIVFFPIDLSDEYVGFLIVENKSNLLEIKYAVTQELTGWGLNASKPEEFSLEKPIHHIEAGKLDISKGEFANNILLSINQIESGISRKVRF